MSESVKFAVGGAVQAQAGTYLRRPADEELFQVCQTGQFAYVLACRQIGKSSLMLETDRRLREAGVRTALIDLSGIGQQNIQVDNWYFSLIDELARELKLKVNVQTWWEDRPPLSTATQRFLQFLRDVVLQEIPDESIVIFVDEIDTTLELDFTDDFFIAIRSVYNDRARHPAYHRLIFVLLGMATPSELIRDDTRTPFNVGRPINIRDFTIEECAPFRQAIEAKYPEHHYFEQIHEWTGGHPYLTQKLGKAVIDWPGTDEPNLVEKLVTKLFFAQEGPGDDSIQYVRRLIIGHYQARDLLSMYKRVLQDQEPIVDDEKSIVINRLKLYGLVRVHNGRLQVRNKLYTRTFDINWIDEMLEKSPKGLGLPPCYQIVQEIGQGGFSTVYLAQMTKEMGEIENVAIKMLNLRDASGEDAARIIKRFEREASAIAKLNHPHIIRIYETNRSDTGRENEQTLFIAMEYIPGGTLGDKLKREGPLHRDEAVNIVKQIGAALTYAHEQGIIHRDIKPENILLDTRAEMIRPVLTDFGLVKDVSVKESRPLTTGPFGTARYMAPEQLAPERWKQTRPTPATDVYALAITFFEMLTGKHPFDTTSDHKLSDPEFINKHLSNEALPRLSEAAPEIGPFFDDILSLATIKDPIDRLASVADFIRAIEAANETIQREWAAPLVAAAKNYIRNRNFDKAQERIAEALQVHPGDIEALRLKGKIDLEQDHYEEAIEAHQQAYEQEADPSAEAGQDYLRTLIRVAGISWQTGAYQRSMEIYRIIKQIRDEHERRGVPVQLWTDNLTKLAQYYHTEADKIYAAGKPDDLVDAIEILKRKIHVLESLGAEPEGQDLQEKLRRLQIQFHAERANKAYMDGKPENLTEAMEILRAEIQALEELEAELESQGLQEKLWRLQIKFHTERADKAYMDGKPENLTEAIEILRAEIQALEELKAEPEGQDLQEKLRRLQIKFHTERADKAYMDGKPENLTKAIEVLRAEIQALEALEADLEGQNLKRKLVALQIKQQQGVIEGAEAAIVNLKAQPTLNNGEVFKHYEEIDKAYQALVELESEQEQWTRGRYNTLKERAELRKELAREAEKRHEYEIALRHYQAILRLEQAKKYEGLGQELDLDLETKTAELAVKADYDRKYQEIEKLVETAPLQALEQLIDDFIEKGVYDHREVAKLLWKLVYATQHDGQFPPELVESEAIRDKLAQKEQELAKARQEVITTQTDLAEAHRKLQEVDQQAPPDAKMLQKFKKQHEINKIVIPLSLLVAVGAGGIIAPQLRDWPGLSVIMAVTMVLLIAYVIYYVWIYYFSGLHHE